MKAIRYCLCATLLGWALTGDDGLLAESVFPMETKLQAGDWMRDGEFGSSVAVEGNIAVVGAYQMDVGGKVAQGAVYVYGFNGTSWEFQQKLTASDGTAWAGFGNSVAMQGDTIVVGAPGTEVGGYSQYGKVYVFTKNSGGWSEAQGLIASDGGSSSRFGWDVSMDGEVMVIGASEDESKEPLQGAAYVYVKSGSSWVFQKKLFDGDGNNGDNFGTSVAIEGETVMVGAPNYNGDGGVNQGAVYVYVRAGSNWVLKQKLFSESPSGFETFGYSLDLSGDTAIVGKKSSAPVYTFVKNGADWSAQATLSPTDSAGSEWFGRSVAIEGNRAVVASVSKVGSKNRQGAVYVFDRSGGEWTQVEKLIASDGEANDYLGEGGVGVSGDVVITGAPLAGSGAEAARGAAYIFQKQVGSIDLRIALNRATNRLTLSWDAVPGNYYTIKSSADLNGFPTVLKAPYQATGAVESYSFSRPGVGEMFYRVEEMDAVP